MHKSEISNVNAAPEEQTSLATLLQHIARYRLSTFEAMSRVLDADDGGQRNLRRLLEKAEDDEVIKSAVLHSGQRYWFLTSRGAERLGIDSSRSGSLSETAKIRAYAMLLFCCLSDAPRRRLLPSELNGNGVSLFQSGMPSTYCYDPSEKGRITLVRVDAGRNGRWDRIVQSVKEDREEHLGFPQFRPFIEARRFDIAILTVLSTKAERIISALKTDSGDEVIPVRVIALKQLLPLVPSQTSKRFS